MDRCALFVDAGYVLTDGAMAVHGTRRRESVSWDYAGLLQLLTSLAVERTTLPVLRCYWYDTDADGLRSAEHDSVANLPGVKLRVAQGGQGRGEGPGGEIHRDLTTLARNKAVSDVMVVSAEEDLVQAIGDVQDMGMRVTLLHIDDDGTRAISRSLRQECDDIVAIGAAQLRPYVELIPGSEPARLDEVGAAQSAPRPAMNGGGMNGNGYTPAAEYPAAYAQPQDMTVRHQSTALPAAELPARWVPQPTAMEFRQADSGQAELPAREVPQPAAMDYPLVADLSSSVDYSASVDYGSPPEYAPASGYTPAAAQASTAQGGMVDYGPALNYTPAPDYGAVPGYAAPGQAPAAAPPRGDIYPAPIVLPAPADDLPDDRDRLPGQPRADVSAYNPGAVREQYQRESMPWERGARDAGDALQPMPVALPGNGSAQVRRLSTRVPGEPGQGQPGQGQPPQGLPQIPQEDAGPRQQPGGQPSLGQPTGSQPVAPVAQAAAPQQVDAPAGTGFQVSTPAPQAEQTVQLPSIPDGQQVPGRQQVPAGQQENAGPPGHMGLVGSGGYPGGAPGGSLADAVQSAHEEGRMFGDSVARDAPALWLEAVLARKPRMPSDLEARLLQGSALPIDYLLHDEVRHALRRGFWDALERVRR